MRKLVQGITRPPMSHFRRLPPARKVMGTPVDSDAWVFIEPYLFIAGCPTRVRYPKHTHTHTSGVFDSAIHTCMMWCSGRRGSNGRMTDCVQGHSTTYL
jgi:hypothetical protein